MSKLRRPFLSNRYFFITVRLLRRRAKLAVPDFPLLARAFNRARALRTVREYNEKVEYIHLNPVRSGLVRRPQEWPWSSWSEYSGGSAEEQKQLCGLTIDRVSMPSDSRTRI